MSWINYKIKKRIMVLGVLLATAIASTAAFATSSIIGAQDLRVHEPNLESSKWQASDKNPLTCKLSQEVPHFGTIEFVRNAGEQMTLVVKVNRGPTKTGRAQWVSRPPDWSPGPASKELAVVDVQPGNQPIRLNDAGARLIIAELERGWVPTLNYTDWDGTGDRIFVSLLPANFREGLDKYYDCEKNMLSFGFDNVRYTVVYFGPNGVSLDGRARKALGRVAQYAQTDPVVQGISLSGFSDSQDDKKESYELSIERLKSVQTFLFGQGVPYEKIDATAYGERNPVADNGTEMGRALNRRVVIELVKD